jgi:hypothetical protein
MRSRLCAGALCALALGAGCASRTEPPPPTPEAARPRAAAPEPVVRNIPSGLALSTPYLGAGYQLVRRSDAPPVRSLAELGEARIGVEVESVPIYTLKQRGHRVHALDDSDAVIEAVADGRVRYGYLWGPLATWLLRDRADVVPVREFEPEERWDFALIVREAAVPLRERLDGALRRLVATGAIEEIAGRYGVRYLRPESGVRERVGSPRSMRAGRGEIVVHSEPARRADFSDADARVASGIGVGLVHQTDTLEIARWF